MMQNVSHGKHKMGAAKAIFGRQLLPSLQRNLGFGGLFVHNMKIPLPNSKRRINPYQRYINNLKIIYVIQMNITMPIFWAM